MIIIKLNHLIYAPVMSTGLGFMLANTNFSSFSISYAFFLRLYSFIPFLFFSFGVGKSGALAKIYELPFGAIHIMQVFFSAHDPHLRCNDCVFFRHPTQ